jgi:hypothetical protein
VATKYDIFQPSFHVIFIHFQQKIEFDTKLNRLGNKTHLVATK